MRGDRWPVGVAPGSIHVTVVEFRLRPGGCDLLVDGAVWDRFRRAVPGERCGGCGAVAQWSDLDDVGGPICECCVMDVVNETVARRAGYGGDSGSAA